MPDFADEASARQENDLNTLLTKRKTLSIPFSGFCLCCTTYVGERRFCDAACRTQWEKSRKTPGYR